MHKNMCSIAACCCLPNGQKDAVSNVSEMLQQMVYRGYDSAGISALTKDDNKKLHTEKVLGTDFEILRNRLNVNSPMAIGQTRWATHGSNNLENTNPQTSGSSHISVVMNGTISNYDALRQNLEPYYKFKSENDTEVIAHVAAHTHGDLYKMSQILEGRYSCIVIYHGRMGCIRCGPSLVVGRKNTTLMVASDIYALAACGIDDIFHLPDNTFAYVSLDDGCAAFAISDKKPIIPRYEKIAVELSDIVIFDEKNGTKNPMTNTEAEFAEAVQIATTPVTDTNTNTDTNAASTSSSSSIMTAVYEKIKSSLQSKNTNTNTNTNKNIIFTGSGSSYHVAMLAARHIFGDSGSSGSSNNNNHHINTSSFPSCEYESHTADAAAGTYDTTLLVAISQSGETGDVLRTIEAFRHNVSEIISVTNNPYSSLASLSDHTLNMNCGQERGVAATKSLAASVKLLADAADMWEPLAAGACTYSVVGGDDADDDNNDDNDTIQDKNNDIVANNSNIFETLCKADDIHILGSDMLYTAALEGALKFKELLYTHAEAAYAGEFKHGPLAMLDSSHVIIVLDPRGVHSDTVHEIRARGCKTVLLSDRRHYDTDYFVELAQIPANNKISLFFADGAGAAGYVNKGGHLQGQ